MPKGTSPSQDGNDMSPPTGTPEKNATHLRNGGVCQAISADITWKREWPSNPPSRKRFHTARKSKDRSGLTDKFHVVNEDTRTIQLPWRHWMTLSLHM